MVRWLIRCWVLWAGARLARDYAWTDGNPDGNVTGGTGVLGCPFTA